MAGVKPNSTFVCLQLLLDHRNRKLWRKAPKVMEMMVGFIGDHVDKDWINIVKKIQEESVQSKEECRTSREASTRNFM